MDDTEEAARRLFAAAAEDVPPGIDLLGGVRARSRGRVVRIRSLVAVGAAAIVAAVVAITVSAVQAPSAFAQVTQAAARTAAQSYQVTSTSTLVSEAGSQPTVTTNGEFDPNRGVGEWTSSQGTQIRNVGGYVYLPVTNAIRTALNSIRGVQIPAWKSWLRIPLPPQSGADVTTAELALLGGIPVDAELVDPQSLLSSLESATAVREVGPASGPGWAGSAYTFTITTHLPGPVHITVSTSGTVDVDQQGRVRQLDAVESIGGVGVEPTGTERKVTLTFGGFGLPVSVSAPPASEVFTVPAS